MKCGPDECPIVAFSDLTPAEQRVERKRTAESMYKRKFTMEQIAKQLGVTKMQISRDLVDCNIELQSKRAKTASNPKGAGRIKGKKVVRPGKSIPDNIQSKIARAVLDDGKTVRKAASDAGLKSDMGARFAIAREQGRREAEPQITPDMLSMSAQGKLDAAIRQRQHKLNLQFEQRVLDEISKRIDGLILPHWKQQIEQAKELYTRRRALMDKDTFNIIRRALHPDSRQSISDHKLGEAFDTFMSLEKYLINEKDSPTKFERPDGSGLPNNLAEWDRMRTRPNAKRAASLRVKA